MSWRRSQLTSPCHTSGAARRVVKYGLSCPDDKYHCHQEGADLFSDLCMWVDINQQYVDLGLFPQWDDIARYIEEGDYIFPFLRSPKIAHACLFVNKLS